MTSYQYRKVYESTLKVKIEEGFAIHHIDFNRKNNHITNLVALPKGLHIKYHYHLNRLKLLNFDIDYRLDQRKIPGLSVVEMELSQISEYYKCLKKFLLCKLECEKFMVERNRLMSTIFER